MRNLGKIFKMKTRLTGVAVSLFIAGFGMNAAVSASEQTGVISVTTKAFKIADIRLPEGNKPLECRSLRLRSLDVIPGGQIGIHSHENRPAILTVVDGEGMRVSAWHKLPVEVKYAESYAELNNIVHYAVNLSTQKKLTLTTFDLLDNGKACKGTVYPQNTPLVDKLKESGDVFFDNAPKGGKDEQNNPLYEVPLSEIHLSKGSAPLSERVMRARKVTLQSGVTLPKADYQDNPSFLYVTHGTMTIDTDRSGESLLSEQQSINLINDSHVVISNKSDKPLTFFVYELVSPDQE